MNRLSPDPNQQLPEGGKSMRHFGLAQNSQEIAHVTFWVDPGGALESCDVITSKGVGAINYEAPFLTNNGTDGAPAQCDINQGYVSVSACGVQSAAPGPGYTYCNNTPSGPASVVGCARFGDINKVRLSKQHVSRQDKCDPGFVITGICSSASNACGSANIRCTSIENIRLVPNVNSADGFFCTRRTLKKGTLTNCNFGELMTEYCSEARCYPGYITCCGVLN